GLLDFHRWANAALFGGSWRTLRELAVQFSSIRTLFDRGSTGDIRGGAPRFSLGIVSARPVGTPFRAGSRLFGSSAAALWDRAGHLHHLGAPTSTFRPRIRAPLAGLLALTP